MKAVVFRQGLAVREIDDPAPAEGEALVRVVQAGICNTDLEIVRGYMGFEGVLGHEMLGVVEAHPDPSWVGRRVTAEINLACGVCEWCGRGLGRHCPTRTVLGILGKDGCFAERVTLPPANLHAVPDGVPNDLAVFTEPLAAAFEILEQVHVEPDARVLVLGDGKLGLLCAMVLRGTGCALTLAGRHRRKMELVAALGVETREPDHLEGKWDVVVEATGSPAGLEAALAHLRPRGTLVLKSTFHGAPEVRTAQLVIDELHVVGSRCGPFPPALRALADARIDPRVLIDARYPLGDALEAIERAQERGTLKIILDVGPGPDAEPRDGSAPASG